MKNRKGFTLIELLAVIVILAIIALIAVPQVLKILNQARVSAAEDSTYGVVEAAESYVTNLLLLNSGNYPNISLNFECDGSKCELSNSSKTLLSSSGVEYKDTLQIKGVIPKNGIVKVSSDGQKIFGIALAINGFSCYYSDSKANCSSGVLSSEYQAVEYIESSGTQYIDTGVSMFNKDKHEIYLDFVPTSFYNYNTLYGSTQNADSFEGWIYATGALAARYDGTRYGRDNTIVLDTRYKAKFAKDGNTLSKEVDDTAYGTGTKATNASTATLLLFLSGNDYGKYKLYNCKLSINNELVRNFIPCYRKSDNAAGLYDLVTKTFYANQGAGSFVIPE